jgi:hypothetical protein
MPIAFWLSSVAWEGASCWVVALQRRDRVIAEVSAQPGSSPRREDYDEVTSFLVRQG